MSEAVNNSSKQRGRPFPKGVSGNARGRPRGSRNKRTQAVLDAAEAAGELPLDYMLRVMRNADVPDTRRDEMAKSAAPYLHSKLSTVDQRHSVSEDDVRFKEILRMTNGDYRRLPSGEGSDNDEKK